MGEKRGEETYVEKTRNLGLGHPEFEVLMTCPSADRKVAVGCLGRREVTVSNVKNCELQEYPLVWRERSLSQGMNPL